MNVKCRVLKKSSCRTQPVKSEISRVRAITRSKGVWEDPVLLGAQGKVGQKASHHKQERFYWCYVPVFPSEQPE